MITRTSLLCIAALLSACAASLPRETPLPAVAAGQEIYVVDSSHTFPNFEVSHLGFSTHRGRFNKTTGWVVGCPIARKVVAARLGKFQLLISEHIRQEVERTLARKFSWTALRIRQACEPIWEIAHHVRPATNLRPIQADPDDDRILECAVDGCAEIIASGDGHILGLLEAPLPIAISHIRILTVSQLHQELARIG